MINPKIQDAINAQINAELWSAYLYLSMAMHFESESLDGIANWFRVQFKEEQDHAEILINYLNERGGRVLLQPIAEVPTEWKSTKEAFEETLKHEQVVTSLIHKLYALAEEEKDYATRIMLDWFVSEQVEEEDSAQRLIDRLAMISESCAGIYAFDRELAGRTYKKASPLN